MLKAVKTSREILFRGKQVQTGEWVYGSLVRSPEHYAIVQYLDMGFNKFPCYFEVIPETVGQFTGLTDKKGVKVFENDIIHNSWNGKKYFVKFVNCSFYMCFSDLDIYPISYMSQNNLKVIGNIHDNPELLNEN